MKQPKPKERKFGKIIHRCKRCGRDLNISFKEAVELCRYLKGRKLEEAKEILEEIIELKRAIPFRTFKKKVPHHKYDNTSGPSRYPKKVAKAMLKILESLEANAEFKGLELSRIKLVHLALRKDIRLKNTFQELSEDQVLTLEN